MKDTSKERGSKSLLAKRRVADKFDVCLKTVDRWTDRGVLPPPKRINGRDYWDADVEPKTDA